MGQTSDSKGRWMRSLDCKVQSSNALLPFRDETDGRHCAQMTGVISCHSDDRNRETDDLIITSWWGRPVIQKDGESEVWIAKSNRLMLCFRFAVERTYVTVFIWLVTSHAIATTEIGELMILSSPVGGAYQWFNILMVMPVGASKGRRTRGRCFVGAICWWIMAESVREKAIWADCPTQSCVMLCTERPSSVAITTWLSQCLRWAI